MKVAILSLLLFPLPGGDLLSADVLTSDAVSSDVTSTSLVPPGDRPAPTPPTPTPSLPGGDHHYSAAAECPGVGDGVAATSWTDTGTAGNDVAASGTPLCENNSGTWEMRFDGTEYFSTATFTAMVQGYTVCYGVRHDNATSASYELVFDDNNASGQRTQMGRAPSTSSHAVSLFAGSLSLTQAGSLGDTNYHRICAYINGAGTKVVIDGAAPSTVNPGGNGLDDLTIGARGSTRTLGLVGVLTDLWFKGGNQLTAVADWVSDV